LDAVFQKHGRKTHDKGDLGKRPCMGGWTGGGKKRKGGSSEIEENRKTQKGTGQVPRQNDRGSSKQIDGVGGNSGLEETRGKQL